MSLSLQSRQVGDITVVKCTGRIVEGAESATLQQHLNDLPHHDPFILFNLGDVQFIDSAGLGFLARLLSRTHAAGGQFKLCAVPARITEVLRITKLAAIFDSYDAEADAIAAFYQRAKSAGATDLLTADVLCVETSLDVLAYVRELLIQAGYGVMTASNVPDALMLLNATQPKVIVVSAALRSVRGTRAADTFNVLADGCSVVELPADFSGRDAGEAGQRLLDAVRAHIGDAAGLRPSAGTEQRP